MISFEKIKKFRCITWGHFHCPTCGWRVEQPAKPKLEVTAVSKNSTGHHFTDFLTSPFHIFLSPCAVLLSHFHSSGSKGTMAWWLLEGRSEALDGCSFPCSWHWRSWSAGLRWLGADNRPPEDRAGPPPPPSGLHSTTPLLLPKKRVRLFKRKSKIIHY